MKAIQEAANQARILWEKHGINKPIRFIGYCLSLLPVPVISQIGNAIDRHLGDKSFKEEIEHIWESIKDIREETDNTQTIEEAIPEIAKAINSDNSLKDRVNHFLNSISKDISEFQSICENRSWTDISNSLINADVSSFLTEGSSSTRLKNTEVRSHKTILRTTDESHTIVDNTFFGKGNEKVSMHGMATQGPIEVTGNSVGFGPGGKLIFGNPNIVSAICPSCQQTIQADKMELAKYKSIKCQHCGTIHRIGR